MITYTNEVGDIEIIAQWVPISASGQYVPIALLCHTEWTNVITPLQLGVSHTELSYNASFFTY